MTNQTSGTEVGLRPGLPAELVDWRISVKCRGCGRWLTDPASVRSGVGPVCASREVA